ncbi:MAG TPA: hypothetical protein VJ351_00470 [Streptosporangiaceae bacterium]|jgi:hypothetical protein|nr:hypothetical protein [Streptosporangiaceae bacterium]
MSVITVTAPQTRTARSSGLLKLTATELKLPAVLQHISHATPLGAAVPALTAAAEGSMPTALQLLTMAGWAAAFGLAAARFFRWE